MAHNATMSKKKPRLGKRQCRAMVVHRPRVGTHVPGIMPFKKRYVTMQKMRFTTASTHIMYR